MIEPAFPQERTWPDGSHEECEGMSLRDYFAAKAMQGQISNPLHLGTDEAHRLIAERAYRLADTMMMMRQR